LTLSLEPPWKQAAVWKERQRASGANGHASVLHARLRQFLAIALLGPHQVGNTTLARQLQFEKAGTPDYLDLENPADPDKLEDGRGYLKSRQGRLVIIDEVQCAPELFQVLRGLIDKRVRTGETAGHFL